MGSLRFAGVLFSAYPLDHDPPHVHGSYAGIVVILDLLADGSVALSNRKDAFLPSNAKLSDVKHVLRCAAMHWKELNELWEKAHGRA
jgi:hypothetical protein